MGNKIVGHCRKVSTTIGLRNVIAHNCRENLYDAEGKVLPEAKLPEYITHLERAPLNEGDRCGASAVLKRRAELLAAANLPRKVQDNAAAAIEGTFSASAEWFEKYPDPKEWSRYFRDIRPLLFELYGEKNVLHWAVHYDELTPHMHVVFVPLTHNQQKKPTKNERAADPKCKTKYVQSEELRYSSSNFLGGNVGLERLHDKLYEQVGKSRGLERGIRGSLARHTDQYSWAAKNARDREELERKAKELTAKEAALELKQQELAQQAAQAAYTKHFHEQAIALLDAKNPSTIRHVQKTEEMRARLKMLDDLIRSKDGAKIDAYRTRLLNADRQAAEGFER